MYIANCLFFLCRRPPEEEGPESTPLLNANERPSATQRPLASVGSLSTGFADFEHSFGAIRFCLINLVIYYLVAVVAYSYVIEHWPVTDSLYFATVVFTTIGYGDLTPSSDAGRLFTIFFALYGITILGLLIGIAGEYVIAAQDDAVEMAKKSVQEKVLQLFAGEAEEAEVLNALPQKKSVLREIMEIFAYEAPIVLLLLVIALIIAHYEGWSVLTSVYWMFISGVTIGFGDISPAGAFPRLAAVVILPLAVGVFAEVLARISGAYIDRKNREAESKFLSRCMTLADFDTMDVNKDGKVSMSEFLSFMLVALQKVEKKDIDEIKELFHRLDVSRTGELDKSDVIEAANIPQQE